MRKLQTIAIVIFSTIIFSSCVVSTHETQVSVMNQETEMNYFDKVDVAGSMNVVLEQSDKCSVLVKGSDSETFKNLVVYVDDNTLYIESKKRFMGFMGSYDMDDITVYVTIPKIKSVDLAGSGNVTVKNPVVSDKVHIDIAGSGDVVVKDSFICDKLSVDIAGSGNVIFKHLKARKLETDIAGSGNAEYMNIDVDKVESDIAGSGNVKLQGKAVTHEEEIVGSGNVDLTGLITR